MDTCWPIDLWVGDTDATAGKAPELEGSVVVPRTTPRSPGRPVLAEPGGALFSVSKVTVGG